MPAGVLKANGYLRGQQHLDGGWGVGRVSTDAQRAAAGSVDMTGTVLAALCETGSAANDPEVRAGLSFLEGRQDPATGGFGNVDSTGWALSGLNACGVAPQGGRFTTSASLTPVDYLLSQQDANGAFLFSGAPNLYSTQNAVRALAGEAFSADPPRRATAADPRFRAVPAVADGTPTPHVLAIDDGAGDVRLCSVTAPAGAALATLLAAAPCGIVAGRLRRLVRDQRRARHRRSAAAEGAWRLRLNRARRSRPRREARAIAFGDTVGPPRGRRRPAGRSRCRAPAGTALRAQRGPPARPGPPDRAALAARAGARARVTCAVRSRRRASRAACRRRRARGRRLVRARPRRTPPARRRGLRARHANCGPAATRCA